MKDNFTLHPMSKVIYKNTIYDNKYMTERINCIISLLTKRETKNKPIVVMLDRCPDLLLVIMAILNIGETYIIIDPNYPIERLKKIIEKSDISFFITEQKYQKKVNSDVIILDGNNGQYINIQNENKKPNELAYILYTSGSTGEPKGVEISRRALAYFVTEISKIIAFMPGKKIACLTTASFDIFFLEGIIGLLKGLIVVLADDNEHKNPRLAARIIEDVDILQMTPSRMMQIIHANPDLLRKLRAQQILIGGEPFPKSLLIELKKTKAQIFNMYGPTETTIWSCISDLTNKDEIDIGRPLSGTSVYIIDQLGRQLNNNEIGELCIGGLGLANGYNMNPLLTEEKFIKLPGIDGKVFQTGDLCQILPCGNIKCFGRMDNQVKIYGYRVELEEIEHVICHYPSVKQVVVILVKANLLAAFYKSDDLLDKKVIVDFLKDKLPTYMIPIKYLQIDEIPLTINGKVNRQALVDYFLNTYSL